MSEQARAAKQINRMFILDNINKHKKSLLYLTAAVSCTILTAALILLKKKVDIWRENKKLSSKVEDVYDVIIVGAGSAGCILANRLSEDKNLSVLLLEEGGNDQGNMEISTPLAALLLQKTEIDHQLQTVPQVNNYNRISNWPRGKVLGGSSSINWMVFVRGNKEDYNLMSQLGCKGWSYNEVLPYFKKLETRLGSNQKDPVEKFYRGTNGPLFVSTTSPSGKHGIKAHNLTQKFVEACQQAGIPYNKDYNAKEQEGVSYVQTTTKDGERMNTSRCFIHNIKDKRPNLRVRTNAKVTKVIINRTTKTATGVVFVDPSDPSVFHSVRARKEVILSAGAVHSPHILLLSGVGPREQLENNNIECIHDLKGVGENLLDHLMVGYVSTTNNKNTMDRATVETFYNVMKYLLFKSGPATSQGLESIAFLKTKPNIRQPDLQLHFVTAGGYDEQMFDNFGINGEAYKHVTHGFTTIPTLLHPKSVGKLYLQSNSPFVQPIIDPHYLVAQEDVDLLVYGVKLAKKINEQEAFKDYDPKPLLDPELIRDYEYDTDEYYEAFVRKWSSTVYHPVGTCKMGKVSDPMSVVNPRGLVYGIKNLRVADCSIFPILPSANTNAPAMLVGEVISDFVKADIHQKEMSNNINDPYDTLRPVTSSSSTKIIKIEKSSNAENQTLITNQKKQLAFVLRSNL